MKHLGWVVAVAAIITMRYCTMGSYVVAEVLPNMGTWELRERFLDSHPCDQPLPSETVKIDYGDGDCTWWRADRIEFKRLTNSFAAWESLSPGQYTCEGQYPVARLKLHYLVNSGS